jgi:hypothetical protein
MAHSVPESLRGLILHGDHVILTVPLARGGRSEPSRLVAARCRSEASRAMQHLGNRLKPDPGVMVYLRSLKK